MSFSINYIECSESLRKEMEHFVNEWNINKEEFIVKTSGSTGIPKEIKLSRNQLIASAKRTNSFFNLNENSHTFNCLPFESIAGKMQVVRALVGDFKLTVVDPSRNPFHQLDINEKLDFIPLSPIQLSELIQTKDLKQFKMTHFLLGGSQLSSDLKHEFLASNLSIFQGYGMTETVSHIALKKIEDSFYHLLEGVSIHSTEDKTIISDSILNIENLEVTDILNFTSKKEFEFIGRRDYAINSGGIKIHPEPIEAFIHETLQIELVLIGITDSKFGEICVCVSENKLTENQKSLIEEKIRSHFSSYAVPKRYFQHSIEKGNYGKILRKKIQAEISLILTSKTD
ncbi:MAG: AMP-binding protein [Fluviicola sp.]|jgi:O-succinylbenzoic acid--CoA ligase